MPFIGVNKIVDMLCPKAFVDQYRVLAEMNLMGKLPVLCVTGHDGPVKYS